MHCMRIGAAERDREGEEEAFARGTLFRPFSSFARSDFRTRRRKRERVREQLGKTSVFLFSSIGPFQASTFGSPILLLVRAWMWAIIGSKMVLLIISAEYFARVQWKVVRVEANLPAARPVSQRRKQRG